MDGGNGVKTTVYNTKKIQGKGDKKKKKRLEKRNREREQKVKELQQ